MKQRLCATCGHRFSMSAKACPHCARGDEPAKDEHGRCSACFKSPATITVNGLGLCGPCFTHRQFSSTQDGPGYAAFKAKLEAERARG
jgi:predicted amidophosphoribosyltransferase